MQCANNFKQVGLAMHNYESSKGCFPIGLIWDCSAPGRCYVWGWSAYVLPYIEQQGVYDQIDFADPGSYVGGGPSDTLAGKPTNWGLVKTVIGSFVCPSDPQGGERVWVWSVNPKGTPQIGPTNMAGVSDSRDFSTGDDYNPESFPTINGIFGANRACAIADIKDGTSNTLMVGEVTGGGKGTADGHVWASANISDTLDGINYPAYTVPGGGTFVFGVSGFSSYHPGGCNFVVADGSVTFISQNIESGYRPVGQRPSLLQALTTRAGEEPVTVP
jgi:prepilin-type processing-associated H-X9-DG protein